MEQSGTRPVIAIIGAGIAGLAAAFFLRDAPARVTWAHHGEDFVAAVENGPLAATQFHPEKSGDTGAALLANWLRSLK